MSATSIDLELLSSLTEASGVPGYEDRVRDLVIEELRQRVDRIRTDAMGNVVATVEGDADFSVAVAAHMDEVGFMVRHVRGDQEGFGFLEIDALGGWDARVLKAQRVTVHTEDGDLPGVIGSPPPHTLDEEAREKTPKVEDAAIDLGLPYEEVKERVSPGDLVTMDQRTEVVGETVTGKALDDRVCLYAMLEAARRLAGDESRADAEAEADTDAEEGADAVAGAGAEGTEASADAEADEADASQRATIHFCATVQEEVGLRGARALGVDIDPDLALALDVTVANDVPGFDAGEQVTRLGEGAAIKLKDSSVITNPKVHRRLKAIAEDADIEYQLEILPAGGTDTAGFQQSHGAKPVGAISIPTRYLHTVTETAHLDDVAATIDLLTAFLEREDGETDYTL